MVLRLIRALPGDICLVATVVRGINPATLAPASERQDHTTSPSALGHVRLTCPPRPPHPRLTCRDDRAYAPLHRGGMRESIVVICPTEQAPRGATDWHDGQFAHGVHAGIARRANRDNDATLNLPGFPSAHAHIVRAKAGNTRAMASKSAAPFELQNYVTELRCTN